MIIVTQLRIYQLALTSAFKWVNGRYENYIPIEIFFLDQWTRLTGPTLIGNQADRRKLGINEGTVKGRLRSSNFIVLMGDKISGLIPDYTSVF